MNLIITIYRWKETNDNFYGSGHFEEMELNYNVLSIKIIVYLFLKLKILDWRYLLRSYLFFTLLFFPSSFIFHSMVALSLSLSLSSILLNCVPAMHPSHTHTHTDALFLTLNNRDCTSLNPLKARDKFQENFIEKWRAPLFHYFIKYFYKNESVVLLLKLLVPEETLQRIYEATMVNEKSYWDERDILISST